MASTRHNSDSRLEVPLNGQEIQESTGRNSQQYTTQRHISNPGNDVDKHYKLENNNTCYKASDITETNSAMRPLKHMSWYWGSISPEYAVKLLENEQDGSFIIRDSSSECYIFSMTFKLDGQVHHTRIEHSKGQYSFCTSRKFYCKTIVDFIEQAIECSKNGNLLFFLHRDPSTEGPVRFKMIPLSRLKCTSSLKHKCRFAILPYVRRSKISELNLPLCLKEYLQEPFEMNNK